MRHPVHLLRGRDALLEALSARLIPGQSLVLVGPGGIGKTAVARVLVERHGGLFVDLSPLQAGAAIHNALADALEVPVPSRAPAVTLAERLAERAPAHPVVLDNTEHVMAGVTELLHALASHPDHPPVVLTSRIAPRGVRAEVHRVGPLDPEAGRAVFLDHAQADVVDPERDRDAIARLVERLGGHPLSLHLASGRTALQGVPDLLRSLDAAPHSIHDVTGEQSPRHASLATVVADSWALLSYDARRALSRASLSRVPLPLEALAGWVADTPVLFELVQASLLERGIEASGQVRLHVLEAVRGWVAEHHPPTDRARVDHARWLAEQVRPLVAGYHLPHPGPRRRALAKLLPELHGALTHAQVLPADLLGELALATTTHLGHVDIAACADLIRTWRPWLARLPWPARARVVDRIAGSIRRQARLAESVALLEEHLEDARQARDVDPQVPAFLAVSWANVFIYDQTRTDMGLPVLEDAVSALREAQDPLLLARALRCLGTVLRLSDRQALRARDLLQQSARIGRDHDHVSIEAVAVAQLILWETYRGDCSIPVLEELAARAHQLVELSDGDDRLGGVLFGVLQTAWLVTGRLERALEAHERVGRQLRALGDRRAVAYYDATMASALAATLPPDEARARLERALEDLEQTGQTWEIFDTRIALALVDHREGAVEQALQAYLAQRATLRPDFLPNSESVLDDLIAIAEAQLGVPATTIPRDPRARAAVQSLRGRPPPDVPAQPRPWYNTIRWLAAVVDGDPQDSGFSVARDGGWLQLPDDTEHDLSRRGPTRRVLARLATARVQEPGATIASEALVEAGWPGERILPESARNRLYTTIRELRRLGLEDTLQTVDGGYRLDPATLVEVR